jgi:dihydroneopterin aldolase
MSVTVPLTVSVTVLVTIRRRIDAATARVYVPAVPTRDAVSLRGMRFHTLVGVLPHEHELPQPLEIDLTVWLAPGRAAAARVIDYRELYALAADTVGAGHVTYLEEVADSIAGRAMGREHVIGASVAVRKPHVALAGPLAHAEVFVERGRRG